MKTIRLKEYKAQADGSYSVYLGNSSRHSFRTKKAAERFLAITSKFLTRKLCEIHDTHTYAQQRFAQCWLHFTDAISEHQAAEFLSDAAASLNLSHSRSSYTDGNYFAFKHLFNAIASIKNALLVISRQQAARSNTAELYSLDAIFNNLTVIENSITAYGQLQAQYLAPQHISKMELEQEPRPSPFLKTKQK